MKRISFKKQFTKLFFLNFYLLIIYVISIPLFARQSEFGLFYPLINEMNGSHHAEFDNHYRAKDCQIDSPVVNRCKNYSPDNNFFSRVNLSTFYLRLSTHREIDENRKEGYKLPFLPEENNCCQKIKSHKTDLLDVFQSLSSKDWNNINSDKIKAEAQGQLENIARTYLLIPLQQETQKLLGYLGTAEFNLSFNDFDRFSNSSASLFTPWYDNGRNLFFSQISMHDKQGRTITNIGIGQRMNMPDDRWRWGYNLFFDYDLRREHRRMGAGIEVAADNLKFAANYYYPLSRWRDSVDIDDYFERPAQGFDIRGQGYFPVYPQLGLSLGYEQYFGEEVGLFGFGKSHWQKDPWAITVGFNYTPVPLAAIHINHKQGQQHKETQFGLTLNYRLGVALHEQLDPDNVATTRSLKGHRMHIVDRNYNIVLEYKEKQLISVDLPPVSPELLEGDSYIMQPLVKTKYPINKVRWFGDTVPLSLVATAGVHNPQGWKIILPAWRPAPGINNTYQLSVEITDEKGNTAISNNLQILTAHNRKGDLSIIGDNKAIASGAEGDAIRLMINILDHNGKTINDPNIKLSWNLINTIGEKIPLVIENSCPENSLGHAIPCVRVSHSGQEATGRHLFDLVSNLMGDFVLNASLTEYGNSNDVAVSFISVNKDVGVTRVAILNSADLDILATGDTPVIGQVYRVKFYNNHDEDITAQISANNIKWLLHGNNQAGCKATLNNYDTGVRGYSFTPRHRSDSNTGLACGDQGFGIKVTYS